MRFVSREDVPRRRRGQVLNAMFARRRRHTKSLTGIKSSGKAGGFDENGRYAAIFCFMRAGGMFMLCVRRIS